MSTALMRMLVSRKIRLALIVAVHLAAAKSGPFWPRADAQAGQAVKDRCLGASRLALADDDGEVGLSRIDLIGELDDHLSVGGHGDVQVQVAQKSSPALTDHLQVALKSSLSLTNHLRVSQKSSLSLTNHLRVSQKSSPPLTNHLKVTQKSSLALTNHLRVAFKSSRGGFAGWCGRACGGAACSDQRAGG